MIYPFRKTVYNCKQATLLSIKREEGKITFTESVKLRYHLFFCEPCRKFIEQWEELKEGSKAIQPITFRLSDEARKKIEEKLSSL